MVRGMQEQSYALIEYAELVLEVVRLYFEENDI